MKKLALALVLWGSLTHASFIKAVAEPDLLIDYDQSVFVQHQSFIAQETKIRLVYDKAIVAFLPFGLWMEAGVKLYETIYTPMLEEMMEPLRAAKAAEIVFKLASDQKVSQEDIDFLTSRVKINFAFEYKPYHPRIDLLLRENRASVSLTHKPQDDITYETMEVMKVDVMHKEGYNFFFLFPKENKLFILNNILIPPIIFCEYNGVFYAYEINFANKSVSLYKNQFSEYEARKKLSRDERRFFDKLTQKPQEILTRHINEFLLIYSNYLKETR
jgi:hypothetical protein